MCAHVYVWSTFSRTAVHEGAELASNLLQRWFVLSCGKVCPRTRCHPKYPNAVYVHMERALPSSTEACGAEASLTSKVCGPLRRMAPLASVRHSPCTVPGWWMFRFAPDT